MYQASARCSFGGGFDPTSINKQRYCCTRNLNSRSFVVVSVSTACLYSRCRFQHEGLGAIANKILLSPIRENIKCPKVLPKYSHICTVATLKGCDKLKAKYSGLHRGPEYHVTNHNSPYARD